MFYKLIEKKRDLWLASDECTVKSLIHYIEHRGMMRDAQIEAIKTYLYLKIACQNKPLWQLFVEGKFNDTNVGEEELTDTTRRVFATTPAAVALFQYSRLRDKKGKQLSPGLEKLIRHHAAEIDYEAAFKKIFYGVSYTDYVFSLPLDEQKSAGKSNKVKNPNAQKINNHQPLDDLMGLVAITNAEKVILDRLTDDKDPTLFSKEELKKIEQANELRDIIGRLPHLSIFIDEVHHAADGEIKLRQVVNKWTANQSFNAVLGFSGTPYLEKTEAMTLFGDFAIRNTDLSNVVYYYPLIEGVSSTMA